MYDILSFKNLSAEQPYRTIADTTYARIRERIVRGELAPGDRIDQESEARRFNVSRMPIREALRRLASEGLVEMMPHRGALVRSLSTDDLSDIYLLRYELEGLASQLGVPELTEAEIEQMRAVLPTMRDIAERGAFEDWLEVDWNFHSVLYAAARKPRLLHFISMLWVDGSRYRRLRLAMPNELKVSLSGHFQIMDACERRDVEGVVSLITSRLADSHSKLMDAISEDGDTQSRPDGNRAI